MSEAEHPIRRSADHQVTLDDVRQLMGASTPHFALQIRNRIARLERLAFDGEYRGKPHEDGIPPLPSLSDGAA